MINEYDANYKSLFIRSNLTEIEMKAQRLITHSLSFHL